MGPTGSRVLFKPNGSDIWHPSCLRQTGQSLQDHVPCWHQGHFSPPRNPGTEPHSKPLAKYVENDPLATYSGHLKGGVRDPLLVGPAYIEGLHLSMQVYNQFKANGSDVLGPRHVLTKRVKGLVQQGLL